MRRKTLLAKTLIITAIITTAVGLNKVYDYYHPKTLKQIEKETSIVLIGDRKEVGDILSLTTDNIDDPYNFDIYFKGEDYDMDYNKEYDDIGKRTLDCFDREVYKNHKIVIDLSIEDINMDQHFIDNLNHTITHEWKHYDVYVTSINPVDENKLNNFKTTNEQIEKFNKTIQDKFPKAHYIDTYNLIKNSCKISDSGRKYDLTTYFKIYNFIANEVYKKEISEIQLREMKNN
jgi:hypothetical protein